MILDDTVLLSIKKEFVRYYKDKLILMKRQIVVPSLFSPVRRVEGKEGRGSREGERCGGLRSGEAWGRHSFVGGNNWRDYYQRTAARSCWLLPSYLIMKHRPQAAFVY